LLFFISGLAVWFAMDRYSTWRFFLERQKRLLLPLVFGMLVVIPPQVYLERLYHQEQFDSFWDFYPTIFTSGSYPQGNLSWHHLWYIPYIWAFSMLMLPLFVAVRSQAGRRLLDRTLEWVKSPRLLFLLFVPSALAEVILRPFWPGDANNLISDWANFTHKLTFFVTGFVLASGTKVYDSIAAHRRKFLLTGIVAFAMVQTIWLSRWHFSRVMIACYHFLANFNIWMWLLAVLGYGRKYLSFNHPFLRQANEAVYPFYILHQTVIIALAYQLAYVNWGIPLKFVVVATATFFICWALYTFAIKPWNVVRVLFGLKWQRPRENPAAAGERLGGMAVGPASQSIILGALVCLVLLPGCSRREGQIVCRSLVAPSLSQNVMNISARQEIVVYLPPSYGQAGRRFPVLYFLPNFKCDLWRYTGGSFQGFRFKQAMDRQIRTGAAKEIIIVIPNTVHFLGGSWYRNSPLTGNWEDYVVHDVVDYVDNHFPTIRSPEARGLAGHGVGGLGALELSLQHPDLFGSVYAMSPALFDEKAIENLSSTREEATRAWQANLEKWAPQDEASRRTSFRDYIQSRLNSPSHDVFLQGLLISYAAAVSPDLRLPYPHIELPTQGAGSTGDANLLLRFDNGMGGWKEKLQTYAAGHRSLHAITIEYGKDDEYQWIRRGAVYVSDLMHSMGIANQLAVHEGGHETTLGKRLETAMLPAISNSLLHER